MPHREPRPVKKRLPRDGAGSFDLPESTGAIKRMVSNDGYMEIYTVSGTYRMQSPDALDPKRTIPDMPWAQKKVSEVGSSNPIVARVYLQTHDALQHAFGPKSLRQGDAKNVLSLMHACKEELLSCESAYAALKREQDRIAQTAKEGKIIVKRNVVECPQIADLDRLATNFLIAAKRAIQASGDVFNEFFAPSKPVKNGNLIFAIKHLEGQNPVNQPYLDFLRHHEPRIKQLIEMRNGQEHPEPASRTVIENIQLKVGELVGATWSRTPEPPRFILPDMAAALGFLIEFAELNFLFGFMSTLDTQIPYRVAEIPSDKRDPSCPIRYVVEIDFSPPERSPTPPEATSSTHEA